MSKCTWSVSISCPRPANRARDDFHVQPHRVQDLATSWFGKSAEITLRPRVVVLRMAGTGPIPIHLLTHWKTSFASALDCLFMQIERAGGECVLPHPVRVDLREDEA
ncbi:hypothetical protein ACWDX8_13365 [Streptomyces anthocyanicus]|uniref:hypothetical protein n=1 Tax=Streptomyces violaceoruber TaxID=1935 RepID=UPI00403C8868